MKKILTLLVLAVALSGCTTSSLLEQEKSARQAAQECVNKGGSPYFFFGEGLYSNVTAIGCAEPDSQLKQ